MRTLFFVLVVVFCCASVVSASNVPFLGNITSNRDAVWENPSYVSRLTRFNQITTENSAKWRFIQPNSGTEWDWTAFDRDLGFAEVNALSFFKAHGLIWRQGIPQWVLNLPTVEERMTAAEVFVTAFLTRYQGRIWAYEIVNEPVNAPLESIFGSDYLRRLHQLARELDPGAMLILNDYRVESCSSEVWCPRDSYFALAQSLRDEGLIDGLGVQGHFLENADPFLVETNLHFLAGLGLPLYITEFDVVSLDDTRQLELYRAFMGVFSRIPAIQGVTLWGFWEGAHWKGAFGGAILRMDFSERPAATWLRLKYRRRCA